MCRTLKICSQLNKTFKNFFAFFTSTVCGSLFSMSAGRSKIATGSVRATNLPQGLLPTKGHAPLNTTGHALMNTTGHALLNTTGQAPLITTGHALLNTTGHAPLNTTSHALLNTTSHFPLTTTSHLLQVTATAVRTKTRFAQQTVKHMTTNAKQIASKYRKYLHAKFSHQSESQSRTD